MTHKLTQTHCIGIGREKRRRELLGTYVLLSKHTVYIVHTYTYEWLRSSSRLLGTTGRTAHDWQRSRQPTRLFYGPPTPLPERGGFRRMDRAITTCRLPLQPMPSLISDTLVPWAEPRPSGSIDIMLEQTFEYWNQCCGTWITRIIMWGIWYKYKLCKEHMADTVVYELCIHKDKEDNSIKNIQELQSKVRAKAIPNTPSNLQTCRRATSA
jgi:hypothetical protein